MNLTTFSDNSDSNCERMLHAVASASDVPDHDSIQSPYFVCMLVWDASRIANDIIERLARRLIDAGCVYFCCWGGDCERVHDVIDGEIVRGLLDRGTAETDDTIMTTWHSDDSLAEFICYALFDAQPTSGYRDKCHALIAIVFDDADRAATVQTAFRDPERFCDGDSC